MPIVITHKAKLADTRINFKYRLHSQITATYQFAKKTQ